MTLTLVSTSDGGDAPSASVPRARHSLAELFAPYFTGLTVELCIVAGFDNRGCLRSFYGAIGQADCNGALIPSVRAALRPADVTGVVIAHNHPDGDVRATAADVCATRRVAALCRLADCELIDHLVFADDEIGSLAADGRI